MQILIKQATKTGYIEMINGGICDLSFIKSNKRRGRVQGGGKICPSLQCAGITQLYIITVGNVKHSQVGKRNFTEKQN